MSKRKLNEKGRAVSGTLNPEKPDDGHGRWGAPPPKRREPKRTPAAG
ncbi:MAG: hypothetical protein ABII00_00190 [Elusimicrobiota bacterium]